MENSVVIIKTLLWQFFPILVNFVLYYKLLPNFFADIEASLPHIYR